MTLEQDNLRNEYADKGDDFTCINSFSEVDDNYVDWLELEVIKLREKLNERSRLCQD